ncbi:MAG: winged helix-turn-helix domain-containing protein [Gammaproteobacteria bacterium]
MSMPPNHPHLKADGRFWLTLDGRNFLGRGRVELLQRIRETGSISRAAKAMKMSYKAAWDAVNAMNAAWHAVLVESGPSGSRLSDDAEQLITAYQQAEARHAAFMVELGHALPFSKSGTRATVPKRAASR